MKLKILIVPRAPGYDLWRGVRDTTAELLTRQYWDSHYDTVHTTVQDAWRIITSCIAEKS